MIRRGLCLPISPPAQACRTTTIVTYIVEMPAPATSVDPQ